MDKEIGSDFYNICKTNKVFFLSGRTAEEFIIRDLLDANKVSYALLPSYCCHTMIEPFLRHKIKVRFFDVIYLEGKLKAVLPEPYEDEVILYLDYFGYGPIGGLEDVGKWKNRIEDCTHSWLCKGESTASYSFCSYRKWTGLAGIAAARKKGNFSIYAENKINYAYEKARISAMDRKRACLEKGNGRKEGYLKLFKEAETLLEKDYKGYRPSYRSMEAFMSADFGYVKKKRRENAKVLYDELCGIEGLFFMFPKMEDSDVPLHVPILLAPDIRNGLRDWLTGQGIYCPVHWPLSDMHVISPDAKKLYDMELSLVCDQRYGIEDMKREADGVKEFICSNKIRKE